jgi:hypothetical protein
MVMVDDPVGTLAAGGSFDGAAGALSPADALLFWVVIVFAPHAHGLLRFEKNRRTETGLFCRTSNQALLGLFLAIFKFLVKMASPTV